MEQIGEEFVQKTSPNPSEAPLFSSDDASPVCRIPFLI
jgi:hypothetical protein